MPRSNNSIMDLIVVHWNINMGICKVLEMRSHQKIMVIRMALISELEEVSYVYAFRWSIEIPGISFAVDSPTIDKSCFEDQGLNLVRHILLNLMADPLRKGIIVLP